MLSFLKSLKNSFGRNAELSTMFQFLDAYTNGETVVWYDEFGNQHVTVNGYDEVVYPDEDQKHD